jgi:hypothetical protein
VCVIFIERRELMDIIKKNGKINIDDIRGKTFNVKIVDTFPDLKVQFVDNFPDIKIETTSFSGSNFNPIKVKIVNVFPDLKVKIVDHFGDVKVKLK